MTDCAHLEYDQGHNSMYYREKYYLPLCSLQIMLIRLRSGVNSNTAKMEKRFRPWPCTKMQLNLWVKNWMFCLHMGIKWVHIWWNNNKKIACKHRKLWCMCMMSTIHSLCTVYAFLSNPRFSATGKATWRFQTSKNTLISSGLRHCSWNPHSAAPCRQHHL